ncbi:MAG: DUF2336 domain-containing protein [Hyphomicrobiales bacterium]|nr:DUF2336 domain-containing protein [Hyphomicrobiales bacterium]
MNLSCDVLENLAVLADPPDDNAERRALLWRITEMFFESTGPQTGEDSDFFGEMMEELAFSLERQVREQLARKIAAEERAPHSLILRLAQDEIPVAQPVLEQSPVLTEDDLIEISSNRSQDHLLAITRRAEIGFRLSAVLAERGNEDVVRGLIMNPHAKLSPDTIDLVAGRSRGCEGIQGALVVRPDVPREILLDLLDHVSTKIRKDIQERLTDTDEIYLDEVVGALKSDIQASRKGLARAHIDELEGRNALNEDAILRFVRDNRPMEFLLGLSRLFSIDIKFTGQIIGDRSGKTLAVACRANRISLGGLKALAASPMTAMSSDPRAVLAVTKTYHRITEDTAKRTMSFLRLRKNMPVQ